MADETTDRRMRKTRRALLLAMSELLECKRYGNITVQDIIDRANVGRSTFYAHFETKEDLLNALIEDIFEMLGNRLSMPRQAGTNPVEGLPVKELFEHVGEHNKLILGLMRVDHAETLQDRIKTYWSAKILEIQAAQGIEETGSGIPAEIYAYHVASTLISLLIWWLKNQMPYTPGQMEQYYNVLTGPAFSRGGGDL